GKELRIVSILDNQNKLRKIAKNVFKTGVDHQACGGTHLDYTGEAGLFKIVKKESIQDGVERVVFKCYLAAIEHIQKEEKILKEIQERLVAQENNIVKNLEKMINEWKKQRKEIEKLQERYFDILIKEEIEKAKASNTTKIVIRELDFDNKFIDKAAKEISERGFDAVLENKEGFVVIALSAQSNLDALEILKEEKAIGGGDKKLARGKKRSKE
ncbi:MAG: hypothetical protein ACK4J0_02275, partial [Candidatus Anstonellaceae archaeon]